MKNSKGFILGLISGLFLIPIAEELLNVVFVWIEYLKILPSKLVMKGNKELSELQGNDDGEYEVTNAIGFQYEPEEYYDDDDEE